MTRRAYEGMFLIDSNRYARDPSGVSDGVVQMIEKCGGEMLVSRLWSEQRLAYPIKGQRKGTYWLTSFRLESDAVKDLNRACQLNGNLLRHLVLTVDERLVGTLVEHARAGGEPKSVVSRPADDDDDDDDRRRRRRGADDVDDGDEGDDD
ncbi:MAG: 30S ribosomal protein S6 [Planctomycetales bacterium]|nr:30S ribosomal protein S6 [Planctomycetales bacterium]